MAKLELNPLINPLLVDVDNKRLSMTVYLTDSHQNIKRIMAKSIFKNFSKSALSPFNPGLRVFLNITLYSNDILIAFYHHAKVRNV